MKKKVIVRLWNWSQGDRSASIDIAILENMMATIIDRESAHMQLEDANAQREGLMVFADVGFRIDSLPLPSQDV